MAFVDPSTETPSTTAQPGQGVQSAPVSAGGAGAAGAGTKAASTAGVNVPAQPSAQLSAYLNANQPQTTALAGNVAGQVGGQIQAAGSAITPAVNTYTGQLATVQPNAAVNQTVATAPASLTPSQQQTYESELGAQAAAPSSTATFETTPAYTSLASQVQNAVEQANLWNAGNNPADISTALSPYEAPSATTGDTTLDSLLVSQTPGAYSQIQSAVAPAANLQSELTAGTTAADASLQNAIAQDTAATQAAQQAASTYANNLNSYLTNAVSSTGAANSAENATLLSDLTNDTPTTADLITLGVTPAQWTTLSADIQAAANPAPATFNTNLGEQTVGATGAPVNLSSYLTQNTAAPTIEDVASSQDYANVAALDSLLGANAPATDITPATAAQAGTAPAAGSGNTFNLSGAEAAAQLAALEEQAQAVEAYGNYADQQYGVNHFGGQTPAQFNTFITDLNGELANLNAQIQALGSSNTAANAAGVSQPSGSGVNAGNVAEAVFPVAALANQFLVNPVESAVQDLGNFLGI